MAKIIPGIKYSKVLQIVQLLILILIGQNCTTNNTADRNYPSFQEDYQFLKEYTDVLLIEKDNAAIAVVPSYQGRVMTSTFDSDSGPGLGWLNYDLIKKSISPPEQREGSLEDHIHAFGGEERFWLGPEGGQFGIFFNPGTEFEFENWYTPPEIDTEKYNVMSRDNDEVTFSHQGNFINWTGTRFDVDILRTIRILAKDDISERLGVKLSEEIELVAYETENVIKNIGSQEWTRETGMLSIWILGMYPPTPKTTVIIPIKEGSIDSLGRKVNDTYFGKVPQEYLKVKDGMVYFKGDGTSRNKIGINSHRSMGIAGSYVEELEVLNIVTYSEPEGNPDYVNSMWELQEQPYSGDVINAYNDGAPEPGEPPLGPFYELETSSPAANLKPGEKLQHIQTTVHLSGPNSEINNISKKVLGVTLKEIKQTFK